MPTELDKEAEEIVKDCIKQKEEIEKPNHFLPTEWMEPFVKPFVHLQQFPKFSTKNDKLCIGDFEISSIYGMYGITFKDKRIYVREKIQRKFLWFKWDDFYSREIHSFHEAMTTLSELLILKETKVWVKFADSFFQESLSYKEQL
jgi:hypothetical protein